MLNSIFWFYSNIFINLNESSGAGIDLLDCMPFLFTLTTITVVLAVWYFFKFSIAIVRWLFNV